MASHFISSHPHNHISPYLSSNLSDDSFSPISGAALVLIEHRYVASKGPEKLARLLSKGEGYVVLKNLSLEYCFKFYLYHRFDVSFDFVSNRLLFTAKVSCCKLDSIVGLISGYRRSFPRRSKIQSPVSSKLFNGDLEVSSSVPKSRCSVLNLLRKAEGFVMLNKLLLPENASWPELVVVLVPPEKRSSRGVSEPSSGISILLNGFTRPLCSADFVSVFTTLAVEFFDNVICIKHVCVNVLLVMVMDLGCVNLLYAHDRPKVNFWVSLLSSSVIGLFINLLFCYDSFRYGINCMDVTLTLFMDCNLAVGVWEAKLESMLLLMIDVHQQSTVLGFELGLGAVEVVLMQVVIACVNGWVIELDMVNVISKVNDLVKHLGGRTIKATLAFVACSLKLGTLVTAVSWGFDETGYHSSHIVAAARAPPALNFDNPIVQLVGSLFVFKHPTVGLRFVSVDMFMSIFGCTSWENGVLGLMLVTAPVEIGSFHSGLLYGNTYIVLKHGSSAYFAAHQQSYVLGVELYRCSKQICTAVTVGPGLPVLATDLMSTAALKLVVRLLPPGGCFYYLEAVAPSISGSLANQPLTQLKEFECVSCNLAGLMMLTLLLQQCYVKLLSSVMLLLRGSLPILERTLLLLPFPSFWGLLL